MFGYIRIRKDDLKIREYSTYRKRYCGLCHQLGKDYGFLYRIITSYDIVFMMLCLENYEKMNCSRKFRCPLNPIKKICVEVSENVMEYCAFINYYMAIVKLEDDILDGEKAFLKKMLLKIFTNNSKYKEIKENLGDGLIAISKKMDALRELEKSESSFDLISNSFGEYFVEVFKLYLEDYKSESRTDSEELYTLCFNLGKWIYMMDAYEDYEEDVKSGKFNLLSKICPGENLGSDLKAHKKVYAINEMLRFKMLHAFQKIQWNTHAEIIFNMINFGCMDVYSSVIRKKYPQIKDIK